MLAGFRDINGVCVQLQDINPIRDAHAFNSSPATLAMLIDSVNARRGVGFSASQLGSTTRQHLLRASNYYPPTAQMVSGHMGTLKHQQINVQREGLIVEQRFTSKRNPLLSGQIDHAAIIEIDSDGVIVTDLYDFKSVKWFSVTLMAKDIWTNHPDYAWQLNLCAAMMEENGVKCAACGGDGWCWTCSDCEANAANGPHKCDTCRGEGYQPVRVRNLYLECIPADSSYNHEAEARKLGFPEFQKVLIPVERKSADETYAVYEAALKLRDEAIANGYAPVCEDRWSNRKVQNLRCLHYCDVRHECIEFSASVGEPHPLTTVDNTLTEQLTKSLEAAV